MHFLTLRVWAAPPPSPGDPQPRGPARSERGREGTMSCEPGMCPQRLFTNTQLFMIAGKRNPTRARRRPDLAGGVAAEELRGGRLFPRSSPGKRPCAQGAARRGTAGPECSARATGAPPLSSRRRGAPAVAVLGPEGTRRPQLFPGDAPRSLPRPFSSAP